MRRKNLLLVPLAILLTVTAGCGEDADETSATKAPATKAPPTAAGPENERATEVVAVDYEFRQLPRRIRAGTKLTLHNDSKAEVHELVAFQLPPDEKRTAKELFALPSDKLFELFRGEPATVLLAPPDERSFPAVGDGTLTRPGRYVIFCAIPTGADPQEYLRQARESKGGPPDVAGGPPHFTAGMFGELVVE